MTEPFSFDFNDVGPGSEAEKAADEITRADLIGLFAALEVANRSWSAPEGGQRAAVEAALEAVNRFIAGRTADVAGRFSRPLLLLSRELLNAPLPEPGNILPRTNSRQAPDRYRRQVVNYLIAASSFAVSQLAQTGSVDGALRQVAEVLRAHRFPQSEFAGAHSNNAAVRAAKVTLLAKRLKKWRKDCSSGANKASRDYARFVASPPCSAQPGSPAKLHPLDWLKQELSYGGYDAR